MTAAYSIWQIISPGLCQCGCGRKTSIAKQNHTRLGHRKGEPVRFVSGHNRNKRTTAPLDSCYVVDEETGCWVWQRHLNWLGYGTFKNRRAHRVVYEARVGPIPVGLTLDHLCRNPSCVNPAHLEPVTQAENVRRGATTTLNVQSVIEIKSLLARGVSQAQVARRFSVSHAAIWSIAHGHNWTDVEAV